MSFTSYPNVPNAAVSGMVADNGPTSVVSYPAGETIPFGRVVELHSGVVQLPQSATLTNVVGISMYKSAREQAYGAATFVAYAVGDMVPILRRGRIYADFTGTTQSEFGVPNVKHSTTTATNRGTFTDAATSASEGVEIDNAPAGLISVKATGITGVGLYELNLP